MLRLLYFLIFGRDLPVRKPPCGFKYPAVKSFLQGIEVIKIDTMAVCDSRPTVECQDGYCVEHHKRRACTCEP